MKKIIADTAGHVGHGKIALVKVLAGTDAFPRLPVIMKRVSPPPWNSVKR